jgi:formamidopyrimidine-DNA glycosylase
VPELPEMQALSERLNQTYGQARFLDAQMLQFSGLKTVSPDPSEVAGHTVTAVVRRGKFLVLEMGGPRVLVHLSQGGRIDIEDPPKATRTKMGVVRFTFEDRPSMLVKEFGTQRKAGWWILADGDEGPLAKLGPDPLSKDFEEFVKVSDDRRQLHNLLKDQRTVAGIGRGFSDDILHRARLSPFGKLATLGPEQRLRLIHATREVLTEATERERERTGGLPTKLPGRFQVHGSAGNRCPSCQDILASVSFEGNLLVYCPSCQTGGKRLADRRLSKLLK